MREREAEVRKVRRRKQSRQRRWTGFVSLLLLVCVLAADFGWGVLVGSSWQKSTGKEMYPENGARDAEGDCGVWENMAYDAQGNVMQYDDWSDGAVPNDDGWNLLLVNDRNPIPEGYEVNLVDAGDGERVDERIYEPLMEMLEYRKQGYSDEEAEELAGQWVAAPGHSEHQLGLAVDLNGATYDVYLWLQANSYKYGFIFRYPGNKTEITGVAEEVWHYRYVGVEAATRIQERGICLEEYVEGLNK